jgi:hypothetical protein
MTRYSCTNRRRLLAVKLAGLLNGIEYLEVRDTDETDQPLRQRTLYVRLLLPVPNTLGSANIVIDGGERIGSVEVDWATAATALPASLTAVQKAALLDGLDEPDHVLVVRTKGRGDFSWYRFALVAGAGSTAPPAGFDPQLAGVAFSFKIECPSDFDCKAVCTCPPGVHLAPPSTTTARLPDFRRIVLGGCRAAAVDRTRRGRLGVTLVEMLAYVAVELSYRRDTVYPGLPRHGTLTHLTATARPPRRHHATAATHAPGAVQVNAADALLAGTTRLSRVPGIDPRIEPFSIDHGRRWPRRRLSSRPSGAVLDCDLNELRFWTWGEQGCAAGRFDGGHPGRHHPSCGPATWSSWPRRSPRRPESRRTRTRRGVSPYVWWT